MPGEGGEALVLSQCFESLTVSRSFIIWYDRHLNLLDCPLHVYYCASAYDGRYNPNRAMVRLTQTVDLLFRRPWYGSLVVVKFASRSCSTYVDLTIYDVIHIRDYFAYFS